jgi:predicted DNA-binding transcriptional regulator AlpA
MNDDVVKELAVLRAEIVKLQSLFLQTTQAAVIEPELITGKAAAKLAGISYATLFNLKARGDFPVGVKAGVGSRKVKWRRKDVLRWVENRKAPRRRVAERVEVADEE